MTEEVDVDFDALEWGEELERASVASSKATASASRAFWGGTTERCRTTLVLRRELADFVKEHGPRFSIQIDASKLRMRLTPNSSGGKFEFAEFKSVVMFRFGHVAQWPNCAIAATDVAAVVHKGAVVVTFPPEWVEQGAGVKCLQAPQVEGVPAGVRRLLNALCDTDSVSHGYLPSLLEASRQDAATWVEASRKWLVTLKPPVVLNDKNNSFFLTKFDRKRVRDLLDAT